MSDLSREEVQAKLDAHQARGELTLNESISAFREDMHELRAEMIKWMVGLTIASSTATITVVGAMFSNATKTPPVVQAAPSPAPQVIIVTVPGA